MRAAREAHGQPRKSSARATITRNAQSDQHDSHQPPVPTPRLSHPPPALTFRTRRPMMFFLTVREEGSASSQNSPGSMTILVTVAGAAGRS